MSPPRRRFRCPHYKIERVRLGASIKLTDRVRPRTIVHRTKALRLTIRMGVQRAAGPHSEVIGSNVVEDM